MMPQSPSKWAPWDLTSNHLRKPGSLVVVWIKSSATAAPCSFCSGSRSHGTSFATTHFMPRSCIKILNTAVLGIPRSASYMFNILGCSACCRPPRTRITFNRSLTIFEVFVPHFYLHCTHYMVSEILLSHLIVSKEKCSNLTQIWCRVVALLTQWHLPPPLTSAVKSSSFTRVHSSPLSLAAANRPHYIKNDCTFSRQTLYIVVYCSHYTYYSLKVEHYIVKMLIINSKHPQILTYS